MTAIGHFAVTSETAWNPSIITFFMHLKGGPQQPPLTAKEFTALWLERQMPEKHPRFHQTVALSQKTGRRQFVEEDCTVQDHITDTVFPANRWDLRLRLQQMQLERWDLSDSLWHVTIAGKEAIQARWNLGMPFSSIGVFQERSKERENQRALKVPPAVSETMLLFRGHHALADGASIGAALSDLFDEAALLRDLTVQALTTMERRQRLRRRNFWQRLWRQWVRLVHFVVGTIQSLLYQGRLLWHQLVTDEDPWRQLQLLESADDKSGNSNDQNYARRTLSWSEVAPVDQVKWVAEILGRQSVKGQGERRKSTITVNDVFVSCITAALARQLDYHRQRLLQLPSGENNRPLPRQTHMNVAVPVHLKGGVILPDESVGNNIGAFVARVPGELDSSSLNNSSVDRLQTVSRELHAVKRTPTALISHYLAKCLSYASSTVLPLSWTSKLYAASNAGSLVVISNNRGSPVPVHLAGRRVESLYGFVPLPPGIPVGVVVMSYAGKVNCTVTAEQWAVPDGDEFMVWVLEEYLHLVEAAKTMQLQQQ